MLRYALYARKSDDDTKVTEKSIGEQIAVLSGLAASQGLNVVATYEESSSAKVPGKRRLYREMTHRIECGEVNAILCWHVNRLARNMEEGGKLAQLLIDGKINEIRTPYAVHRSGDNILPLVLDTATSTQFSLELVRNVGRGMRGHFEQGGLNYKARQGYRNLRDPDNPRRGIVVPDEPRYTLIRKGFDLLLTGAYNVWQVAQILNETWGYRTRKTEKQGGTPLRRTHAYQMFRDPFYAGFVRYKGEVRRGSHQPMLTAAEFARVQEILGAQERPKHRSTERAFAYTGLMRCGHCGAQITAERHTLKNGHPYIFYRCTNSRGACTKKGLSERRVEEALAAELSRITLSPALCEVALQNILRSLAAKNEEIDRVSAQQQEAVRDVEGQMWRLEEMWLKGLMTDLDRYRTREKQFKDERQKLLVRAEASRMGFEQARETARNAGRFVTQARGAFLNGDVRKRREIVQALAIGYRFFGPERRIEVDLDPLLAELVVYARALQAAETAPRSPESPLELCQPGPKPGTVRLVHSCISFAVEPGEIGFQTKETAPARAAVSSGSPDETQVDIDAVPESLIRLCIRQRFPPV